MDSSGFYLISDLHLGHKRIVELANGTREGIDSPDHDRILKEKWHSVIKKKRSVVYVLGDIAFNRAALDDFATWSGTKFLVRGNHDILAEEAYRRIFMKILGLHKKHGFWFSHAPVHPDELRGYRNVHGHLHSKSLSNNKNGDYVNVCVESTNGYPIAFDDISSGAWKPRF